MTNKGFTLIEMMVAVSIFAIVMMIGVGALLSLVEANRRAQAINSVVNNLNAALESMGRSVRTGATYHCSVLWNDVAALAVPQDCTTGGALLAFEPAGGDRLNPADQVVYRFNPQVGQLQRSTNGGADWIALTAPEVTIEDFDFYVVGASASDDLQPRVLIRLDGSTDVAGGTPTRFKVQTTITQRIIDI